MRTRLLNIIYSGIYSGIELRVAEFKKAREKLMPKQNIYRLDPKNLKAWSYAIFEAKECLLKGGVIAIPTDTLYGLCTLVENADKLYRIKKRPDGKPLGVFVNDVDQISRYSKPTTSSALLKALFPGPVTVVLLRNKEVPDRFNPDIPTISFRIPQSRFARDLCRELPYHLIAQTSANISGTDQNPIQVEEFKELWDDIDLIIDAGPIFENNCSRTGSTIVDLTIPNQYRLLRSGCAPIETMELLKEFGVKSADEVQKQLKSGLDEEMKRLEHNLDEKEKIKAVK